MKKRILFTLLSIVLLFTVKDSFASHMFGADLYYTYLGGGRYRLTLNIYGDCSGGAFPTLHTSKAEIKIYKMVKSSVNTDSFYVDTSLYLPNIDTAGTEVSPVCPGELHNTNCNGGTLPGIKRFTFQEVIKLNGRSEKWVLSFEGNLSSSSAGRSASITNLSFGGTLGMVDTLNNMTYDNSSAYFTTIPTPFFCINEPENYNPGAIDPDGDSLVFKLIPGIDAPSGTVTYLPPYTATAPLATTAGTFNFSNTTGQISFTANALQKALVVEQVYKYRDGVLLGTSMREMTFVVLSCTNPPPSGGIAHVTNGNKTGKNNIVACQSDGNLSFDIAIANPSGANVKVSVTGLPKGATYTVTNDSTPSPSLSVSWDVTKIKPADYNFFVTLKDDNCPLSNNITQAYTITVLPRPDIYFKQLTKSACRLAGRFAVAPTVADTNWSLYIKDDSGKTIDSFLHRPLGDTVFSELYHGQYQLILYNENNCFQDSFVNIEGFAFVQPTFVIDSPSCYKYNDGDIKYSATGVEPITFKFDGFPPTVGASGILDSIPASKYHLTIIDSLGCEFDTTLVVDQPLKMHLIPITTPNNCEGQDINGTATINAIGGHAPYSYLWINDGNSTSQKITGLANGEYRVFVHDAHNCVDSSVAVVAYDDCCKPYIPTAFTPNGDGKNDVFHIMYKGDFKLLDFSVYNRAGVMVYHNTSDAHRGWDGKVNGVVQDVGTYYYYIKGICGNNGNHVVEFKGDVTLIQ